MKHLYFILAVAFACSATLFTSCSDDNDAPKEVAPKYTYGKYQGNYKAYLSTGELSKKGSGQIMRFIQGTENDTLYMDQISFTDKVPYAFDIRFGGIVLDKSTHRLELATKNSIPEMIVKGSWKEMPNYTISDFFGHISNDSLYLEFDCGENRLFFAGKYSVK